MSECKLHHSQEDVRTKLESQKFHLPEPLYRELALFVGNPHVQQTWNELFHLLKKYDLASPEEQAERNGKLTRLLNE